MADEKLTREDCLALLRETRERLLREGFDRYPKRADFEEAQVVAIKAFLGKQFTVAAYTEHALTISSKSDAVAYVGIEAEGKVYWGVGIRKDISDASAAALFSALDRWLTAAK